MCWTEVSERKILGLELVQLTTDKIKVVQQWQQISQSRYKIYVDVRRKLLEFQVGGRVFLKVLPSKGIALFGKHGKLNSRFIWSFKVIRRIGAIAYCLDLPLVLVNMHNVFHVSMFQKYLWDPSL